MPIRNQEYTVSDDPLEFTVNWAESVGNCGGLIYSATMGDGSALQTNWIKFDMVQAKFIIMTQDRVWTGIHNIKISAMVKDMMNVTASQAFKVEVKDYCADASVIQPSNI